MSLSEDGIRTKTGEVLEISTIFPVVTRRGSTMVSVSIITILFVSRVSVSVVYPMAKILSPGLRFSNLDLFRFLSMTIVSTVVVRFRLVNEMSSKTISSPSIFVIFPTIPFFLLASGELISFNFSWTFC